MPVRVLGCKEKLTVDKLRRKRIDYNSRDPQEAQRIRFKNEWGTSLVVEWIRIHLSLQGTQVRSLILENPTCCGATKPVGHNYRVCPQEPASRQLLKPLGLEPVLHNKRRHHNKKSSYCS